MKTENLNGYVNQFLITDSFQIAFQSYKSLIATYDFTNGDFLQLNSNRWDYSTTTRRHFKSFINDYTPFTYECKSQWLKEIQENDKIEVE